MMTCEATKMADLSNRPSFYSPPPSPPAEFAKQAKPDMRDEVLRVLRQLLDCFLWCLTCGCYGGPRRHLHGDLYESELMEEERVAVRNLLTYLGSDGVKEHTLNDERLRALCILTYSDNLELQRSAALCFAELSESMREPVSQIVLEPLIVLLRTNDATVQKTASLALSNFALNGPDSNKLGMLMVGAMKPLIALLRSDNVEVQCNACGCITTLATNDKVKLEIVYAGGVAPLLKLARSRDIRVQRNATGALLNVTHLQSTREHLVQSGALAVLVEVLHTDDADLQHYCAAALSNMAVNERHRTMTVALGQHDVIKQLIRLLSVPKEKVKCQACLALRNLACDMDNQVLIVRAGCLPPLRSVLQHSRGETLSAAVAALRNLSIHRANEEHIISGLFLTELNRIVKDDGNPAAQLHAAGTIRNLAAGEQTEHNFLEWHSKLDLMMRLRLTLSSFRCLGNCIPSLKKMSDWLETLLEVFMSHVTRVRVLEEVTAAIAVLVDEESTKQKLLQSDITTVFQRLLLLAEESDSSDVRYNCAGIIGQLALTDPPLAILADEASSLLGYLGSFLESTDLIMNHLALWTIVQLLKFNQFSESLRESSLITSLRRHANGPSHTEAVQELATAVLQKLQL